ncbi:hypothetical protein WR25_25896 [Diploscapter pachys]|uniref:Ubiquitin carboxyl-terminal hydrolase n=1 Tax=Diploscapter pachys TaxID=2018661 RepID=A0A2A2L1P7_9BILA|nr:hypothetical protein WR25_25896 [Diploscapter pachys]
MSKVTWKALESNPESINEYLKKIGVNSVETMDVYSFDEEMLNFIPKPQLGMILCFPDFTKVMAIMQPVYEKLKEQNVETPEGMFFMDQRIGNACGTFALFHALANLDGKINLGDGPFAKFLAGARPLKVEERSDFLASYTDLAEAHDAAAVSGETENSDEVENHFIAFVNWKGQLYEIGENIFPH